MAEELEVAPVIESTEPQVTVQTKMNPFDDTTWAKEPIIKKEPVPVQQQPVTEPATQEPEVETVDANDYLVKETGWKSWEEAKADKAELEKLRTAKPEPFTFKNEDSKKYFDAIAEGKEDDIYNILAAKKQIERVEKLDPTKVTDAASIVKLKMLYDGKESGIEPDDVDFLFEEKFAKPDKPEQRDDQTDDEYAATLSRWEKQVANIEKKLTIEAKLAKPELSKYKSELVLPDIPKAANPASQEPTPEVLERQQKAKEAFLKDVESGLTSFNNISTVYKDEEVEIPIKYEVTNDEKGAVKNIIDGLFTDFSYFLKRWGNTDGTYNTAKMAEDIYLMENKEKVIRKFANEAGSQRLLHQIKTKSNINLSGAPSRTQLTPEADIKQREKDAIWSA